MHNKSHIPRWFVESDPSWEKSVDFDLHVLKWAKKGTTLKAMCHPTDMYCQIVEEDRTQPGLSDISVLRSQNENAILSSAADDIRKFLSSRYLNSRFNGPRFDLRGTSYF